MPLGKDGNKAGGIHLPWIGSAGEAEEREGHEVREAVAERRADAWRRVADLSLDAEDSRIAQARADEWDARALEARMTAGGSFSGSFGDATAGIRRAYSGADDMAALFNSRNAAMLEVEGSMSALGSENASALLSGIEYGGCFVGTAPAKVRLISVQGLGRGVLAQAERRGGEVVIRVNARRLAKLTADQVEQVAFHEMAHTVEYGLLSQRQFEREIAQLIDFQLEWRNTLPQPTVSRMLQGAARCP